MIIIGEKINGTRKAVAAAIREKDADFIRDLAKDQADGGSTYLDVNAGTAPDSLFACAFCSAARICSSESFMSYPIPTACF